MHFAYPGEVKSLILLKLKTVIERFVVWTEAAMLMATSLRVPDFDETHVWKTVNWSESHTGSYYVIVSGQVLLRRDIYKP